MELTQENLQKLKDETIEKREAIESFIICNDNEFEARATTTFNYGDGTVKVCHKKYNWIEFLDIRIDTIKNEVDFSHGSGGWNDGISAEERINATLKMFNMAKNAIDNKEELLSLVRDYMKSYTVFMEAVKANTEKLQTEELEKAKQELLKTHKEVDVDEVMQKIEDGEIVEVTRLYYDDFKKAVRQSVNKFYFEQMKRKAYKMNGEPTNKDFIHSYLLNTQNLFISL